MVTRATSLTALLCLLLSPLWSYGASDTPPTLNETFRDLRKITTKDGIEQQEFVAIGGTKQWISIRARHKNLPILLVVHGGPGFTLSAVSDYSMRDWEEFFTVVQWDQRASGKSFRAEDKPALAPTLTIDRLVLDTAEMIEHLRTQLHQDRVVLLAHSFGTIVGAKLAQERPDLLYAYVGMGQFVNAMRGEKLGYEETLADARADKNQEAIKQLESIAPYPDASHPERNLQNLQTERQWLAHYGGYYAAGGMGHFYEIAQMSPTYTAAELDNRQAAHNFVVETMWPDLAAVDLTKDVQFKVPVIIMQGRHDRGTPSALVKEWHESLKAPYKKLVWFDDSSHMLFEEEPGKLLVALVTDVLPLTKAKK